MRWKDDVEDLGVVNWRAKAQDRDGWRKFLRRPRPTEDCSANNNTNNNNNNTFLRPIRVDARSKA
jgi:hypothetical protein